MKLGFYSWYNVDSKCDFPWLDEVRDHVDPLLKIPKKQDHMAVRQLMKKVYEKSLNGLWISTGTYYLFPSQYDKLESLRLLVSDKEGINLHYVGIDVRSFHQKIQTEYILRKYEAYLDNMLNNEFDVLISEFEEHKKAYVLHKIEKMIEYVKNIEDELLKIGISVSYSSIMKFNLDKTLENV